MNEKTKKTNNNEENEQTQTLSTSYSIGDTYVLVPTKYVHRYVKFCVSVMGIKSASEHGFQSHNDGQHDGNKPSYENQ